MVGAVLGVVLGLPQGWMELRVLGLVCLALLAFALAWVLGRTIYEVEFDLHRQRVVAGETASGRVLIRNRGRRALFPTRIELNVGRGRAHFMLPSLATGDEHEQLFDVPTRRRGVITIGPVASVRTDPLGLLGRTQRWADSVDLYVHPVTVALLNDSTGFIRDIEGVTTQELSSSDVSFHALREYQPGDDRRAIHWRTTARVGRLMVRQFEETRRAHLLVVLPTHPDDYGSEADLEAAISVAASLGRHAFSLERQVSIHTSSGLVPTASGPLMLDRLAELEPATQQVSLRDLAAKAIRAVPQASVVTLLAGGPAEPLDLRAAHKALPLSVSSFAVRCAGGTEPTQRRIGDLTLLDVPDVQALPRAIRSLR
ncbi:DUF58 domain-containing protein [Nocardioides sp. JQ2195]|uniref:DUF58 domain-containing protein n=1 Tax=Nocardioides sp. JQ2195 TaxID=2592334 RepID=UPI00143E4D0B|nr:DUF58 domain-containing protein [Nocardioides sp. JQ2195]QIX25404.1 DUF58 domain-containing protein [Nocardioides sp. JQ2195]